MYKCKVDTFLPEFLHNFAFNLYPHLKPSKKIAFDYYATFYLEATTGSVAMMSVDARTLPLNRIGGTILGLKTIPPIPTFTPTRRRKIKNPYVCIAVQASGTFKGWYYPGGWDIVVDYLKKLGYRVLCIDAEKSQTDKLTGSNSIYTINKPQKAENYTGLLPLLDRANMLYYADFFIGVSSGLAWVANAVGCPVVLISGFTQGWNEFYTPYRVSNRLVCNGCYNDVRLLTIHEKVCPRYAENVRELECSKKISPRQVIQAIDQLIKDKNLLEGERKTEWMTLRNI